MALRISGFPIFRKLIYSYLAMCSSAALDLTFHALADATRRSMIHALAKGETRTAGELGRHFRSAQPTISKHLRVLVEAGILERKVEGRVHQFRLRRKALEQAGKWIARHQAFWEGAVNQLDRLLAEGATDDRG
jgi:DNA-binding transcriptional ArsR family regulator